MPVCPKDGHNHVFGDGCKCPDCEQESQAEDVKVPLPEEGEHNPEDSFLEEQTGRKLRVSKKKTEE